MLKEMIFLQAQGYYGQWSIGDMLNQWAAAGFFSYLLPFLLIFALVYGILSSMQLFKDNRAVDAIVALVVGLLALQFDFVPVFFAAVFPRMAVGLAIILVLLILAGFFVDPTKGGIMYTLLGIGVIVTIIVLVQTAGSIGWSGGQWWYYNWSMVAGVVFLLIVIAIIVGGSSKKQATPYVLGPFRTEK